MTLEQETKNQITFTAAHHDFERGLNVHAFFKLQDRGISEGLVQDTFVKTWMYLVKGGKVDVMRAFLYHILNNLIVDEYRKNKTTSLDILLEKGFEPSSDTSGRIPYVLDGRTAFLLIQHIPEKYQKVMRMRYIHDLSLKEISIATGQSKNTVAVQAHRGLEKLKLLYSLA